MVWHPTYANLKFTYSMCCSMGLNMASSSGIPFSNGIESLKIGNCCV